MMKKTHLILVIFISLLFSCQSNNVPTHTELGSNLFLDNTFTVPPKFHIETEQEIFQLDEEMKAIVKTKLMSGHTERDQAGILLDYIFNEEGISLRYNGNANLTASQAYHSQSANCMSLTIMTYALAHAAGINAKFQQVYVPEYWVRNGQHNFLTGHVNIAIVVKKSTTVDRKVYFAAKVTEIDFDPYVAKEHFPKKTIKKNTILAMFYNNKGADALVHKDYDIAYQYFKAAIEQDDKFSSAWGNLAVLYRFTENYQTAEKVYRHTLMLKKDNLTALTNLALLLRSQNQEVEAQRIDDYLHQIRKSNPYYFALLADEAFHQKKYEKAESNYKKAIQLEDRRHEFYFALAKVYYKQNKIMAAKRTMKKAIKLNGSYSTNKQYIAKLNFLKQLQID